MSQLHILPTRKTAFPFLQEVDFTKLADILAAEQQSGLHSIVRPAGREDDIEEMRLNLMSANTNSIWLQGEEGVGKTLVISGLLQKIARKEVTASMLARRFYIFNAHNFFKGHAADAFNEFDKALDYLNASPSLLIFDRIDDFVTTAGSDATFYANAVVDTLSEGHTQMVVTSQLKTRDVLDKASTAFAPSFVEQVVLPPDKVNLLATLRAHRPRFERVHAVHIPEEAIQETVRLLENYPGRAFTAAWPQGPLALMDKASAYVRMARYGMPPAIIAKTETLLQLEDELSALRISSTNSSKRIAEIQADILRLKAEVEPARKAWDDKYQPFLKSLNDIAVTEKDIAEVQQRAKSPEPLSGDPEKDKLRLSPDDRKELNALKEQLGRLRGESERIYGALNAEKPLVGRGDIQRVFSKAARMTLDAISGDERAKLLKAEEVMGRHVFSQPVAITATADILRAARSGVADPGRPAGVIMYVGATGTGKTELAKALAELDGGEGAKPIIIRMNQYSEESAISQFKGASPGYVGYSPDGSLLMQKLRKNTRAIPVLDEIEKAHETFFDTNMSMLDEGVLEDGAGNEISFKDRIIVLTSNVLLPEDMTAYDIDMADQDAVQQALRDALKKKVNPRTGRPFFKEEFVERIDNIVMFDYLKDEAACNILHKEISKQNKSLEGRNYRLEADDATIKAMIATYFKPRSNGRTVRQFYNRLIRAQISHFILSDPRPPLDDDIRTIAIRFEDGIVRLQGIGGEQPVLPAAATVAVASLTHGGLHV